MMSMTTKPADALEIYEGNRDFYVPTYKVYVDGRNTPADVIRDITQVSYRDNIAEMDSFEITINNYDAETRTYKYSDEGSDHIFDPGKKLELYMGYYGQTELTKMIEGEITQLRPNFPASGAPTLQISGLNILHRFRKKQNTESYLEKDRHRHRQSHRQPPWCGHRSGRLARRQDRARVRPSGQPVRHYLPDGAGAQNRL